jgi:hypothetical protein
MNLHESQVSLDNADIPLQINVGLYDSETGQRLKLLTGGDAVNGRQGAHE